MTSQIEGSGFLASKVLSVNVGMPMEFKWRDRVVRTGIFKEPVEGRVSATTENLAGDGQADTSVHGGKDKAVYVYPSEHYPLWKKEFPAVSMPWGVFGENLTTVGLSEDTVKIGDRFLIGSAELIVTQPRMPCFKLGIRFGAEEIVRRFRVSGKSGWYCLVAREGAVSAGDKIQLIDRESETFSVKDVLELHESRDPDLDVLQRVIQFRGLSEAWREHFRRRLATPDR